MSTVPAIPLSVPVLGPSPKERLDEWFSASYTQLLRRARAIVRRERRHPTLDAGMLVHETYARLAGYEEAAWSSVDHFYRTACRVMTHVLLDWVRSNQCEKRGSGACPQSLHRVSVGRESALETQLSIRQALKGLGAVSKRMAAIVEYKTYGDLTDAEIADALQVSTRTVRRDWARAKSVLRTTLK